MMDLTDKSILLSPGRGGLGDGAQRRLSVQDKLGILADAAKYDVACTSSGVDRKNGKSGMGTPRPAVFATALPGMAAVFHF